MTDMSAIRPDLTELAKPFHRDLIKKNPQNADYVQHSVVVEKLLWVLGGYDWEIAQVVRGFVPGKAPNPNAQSQRGKNGTPDLHDAVVAVVGRLRVNIDGVDYTFEEAGDCGDPHNWPHDGARLKDATSDALKRCAMRAGVGLHLWSRENTRLYAALSHVGDGVEAPGDAGDPNAEDIEAGLEPVSDDDVPRGTPADPQPVDTPVEDVPPGWGSMDEHDQARDIARARAQGLPEDLQATARSLWGELGLSWPLTRDEMGAWMDVIVELEGSVGEVVEAEDARYKTIVDTIDALTPSQRGTLKAKAAIDGLNMDTIPKNGDDVDRWIELLTTNGHIEQEKS